MNSYLTYMYLLTPLHTGGSSQEGNLMGIAREVHTKFPYLPSSSLRGKIRAEMEKANPEQAGTFFGERIKNGQQPTEGDIWFADATLLFFPIASFSHHLIWITCPLWLSRWNRWLPGAPLSTVVKQCKASLDKENTQAVTTFEARKLYMQGALLHEENLEKLDDPAPLHTVLEPLFKDNDGLLTELTSKLAILTDEDCAALVETGLQREVRVALKKDTKTVEGGSFRSEEAIPPEAVLFFSWGMKDKQVNKTAQISELTVQKMSSRLQFGGLEGLGRGWAQLKSIQSLNTGEV